MYQSSIKNGGLISTQNRRNNGNEPQTQDRMEELQRRKDREGGEHLEMMIKQTRRGAKKPKVVKQEKSFIEDKINMIEIVKESNIDIDTERKLYKKENIRKIKVDFSPDKKVEKVSLIDIKLDENPKEKRDIGDNNQDQELKKRNFKEFEENNYENMFDSDKEDQNSRRSEENNRGFLQEQNEKQDQERRMNIEKAHETMEKKVKGILKKNSKLQPSEEEYDDKEEEPLNSQDDISGR